MDFALLITAFLVAVIFDFTNGFHDTPMAVATSISTKALSPTWAVSLASVLNFLGALVTVVFFHAKVSNTLASLLVVRPSLVLIIAGLTGSIIWNVFTWYLGLPSSSSHAFIGGLIGAAFAAGGGPGAIRWSEFGAVAVSLVTSPAVGFVSAAVVVIVLLLILYRRRPEPLNRTFRLLQIPAAAFVAFSHGSNDAQKTMAAMGLALVAGGYLSHFEVPVWVVVVSATAMGAGTYTGGWRIMRTLGWRIFRLQPATGMAAQVMGASVIQAGTQLGLPVSTTHCMTGSIMGAGFGRQPGSLNVQVVTDIIASWVITIPAAGSIAWVMYAVLHTAGLRG